MPQTTSAARVRDLVITGEPPLAARLYLPPAGNVVAGAVLSHGLASCQDEFEDLPDRLAQAGIAALTFDFRGHGRSGGERSYNTAEGQRTDLERAITELERHSAAAGANLFLIGHSLGCVPTLSLLARDGERFAGGVALAPGASAGGAIGPAMRLVYEGLYQVARAIHSAIGVHVHVPYQYTYRHLYADPAAVRRAQVKGFLQPTVSLLNYPYLFREMNNLASAGAIRVPMLVMVGSEDVVLPNDQSRAVFDALATEDKEWVRIVGAGHSLLGDRGGEEAMAIMTDWIVRHANRPAREEIRA